jgi:hypothetical protein
VLISKLVAAVTTIGFRHGSKGGQFKCPLGHEKSCHSASLGVLSLRPGNSPKSKK